MTPNSKATRKILQQWGQQGLLGHGVPREWRGHGNTFTELVRHHEKTGRTCHDPGLILALNAHLWGALFPVLRFGNMHQKRQWLPELVAGSLIGGHAITEPEVGSNPAEIQTRAESDGNGFRLNGHKRYITNAPIADVMIIYASLQQKLSAFVLVRGDPGFHTNTDHPVMACQNAPMGEVLLEDCRIPAERLLGKPGAGLMMIQSALEWERAFLFAGIAGAMHWQLDQVIDYSRKRQTGGGHLGRHQAISHRIADMATRLDTLRLWLKECARLADAGNRITVVSAQTKLVASEAFLQSTLDALHILGAKGLETSSGMSAWLNDAVSGRLFSGSSEIQKNLIAALLGTGEGYRPK